MEILAASRKSRCADATLRAMIPPLVFDLLGLVALFYTLTTRAVPVSKFLLALAASALAFWAHLRVHELWAGRVLHLSPQEARALPIFEPLLAAQTVATVLADRRRFADGAWVLHLGELAAVRAMSLSRFCKGALSTTQGAEADWARAAAMCALLHVALLTLARLVGAVDEPATTKAAASGPPPARVGRRARGAAALARALRGGDVRADRAGGRHADPPLGNALRRPHRRRRQAARHRAPRVRRHRAGRPILAAAAVPAGRRVPGAVVRRRRPRAVRLDHGARGGDAPGGARLLARQGDRRRALWRSGRPAGGDARRAAHGGHVAQRRAGRRGVRGRGRRAAARKARRRAKPKAE